MSNPDTNLCTVLVSEMEKLQFRENSINAIKSNQQFVDAFDKNTQLQRTMLTMLFYRVLVDTKYKAPSQIRLALNIATDITGWLDDLRLVILPFLKENEDKFFVQ